MAEPQTTRETFNRLKGSNIEIIFFENPIFMPLIRCADKRNGIVRRIETFDI